MQNLPQRMKNIIVGMH